MNVSNISQCRGKGKKKKKILRSSSALTIVKTDDHAYKYTEKCQQYSFKGFLNVKRKMLPKL